MLTSHIENDTAFLGLIRDLTRNNVPFLTSLYTLFSNVSLSGAMHVAIEEGFIHLFANLISHHGEQFMDLI